MSAERCTTGRPACRSVGAPKPRSPRRRPGTAVGNAGIGPVPSRPSGGGAAHLASGPQRARQPARPRSRARASGTGGCDSPAGSLLRRAVRRRMPRRSALTSGCSATTSSTLTGSSGGTSRSPTDAPFAGRKTAGGGRSLGIWEVVPCPGRDRRGTRAGGALSVRGDRGIPAHLGVDRFAVCADRADRRPIRRGVHPVYRAGARAVRRAGLRSRGLSGGDLDAGRSPRRPGRVPGYRPAGRAGLHLLGPMDEDGYAQPSLDPRTRRECCSSPAWWIC